MKNRRLLMMVCTFMLVVAMPMAVFADASEVDGEKGGLSAEQCLNNEDPTEGLMAEDAITEIEDGDKGACTLSADRKGTTGSGVETLKLPSLRSETVALYDSADTATTSTTTFKRTMAPQLE